MERKEAEMESRHVDVRVEHERNYGLGMDALRAVCSWNTNGIMVWAWMLWFLEISKHERNYGLGMTVLLTGKTFADAARGPVRTRSDDCL